MKEPEFQSDLIKEIRATFPGCIILKNDACYKQGIPDLLVLNGDRWAALECKESATASHRPNQDYYVSKMNKMSYARFIYPENKEDILDELQLALKPTRHTRKLQSKQDELAELHR